MAEVVDIVREYSKEFIMYPINERLDKMENYFKLKLEQMEQLINDNIHKSNQMDRTLETIQSNDLKNVNEKLIKLEGNNEFIFKANEEKHQNLNEMFNQREIKLNSIINHFEEGLKKLSKDFTDFEVEIVKKNKKLNESVMQNAIKSRQLNEKMEMIKIDLQKNSTSLNKDINQMKTRIVDATNNLWHETDKTCKQLQLELRSKDENNQKKFEKIDQKLKIAEDIHLLKLKSLKDLSGDKRN
ncbi:hypothetical protein CHUAL_010516 [Chamberlinius hualienensis]